MRRTGHTIALPIVALISLSIAGCGGSPSASTINSAAATPLPSAPSASSTAASAATEALSSADSPTIQPADPNVLTFRGGAARSGVMPGPGPVSSPVASWTFHASGPIDSQVSVAGGVVYVVATNGRVTALDLLDGSVRWTTSVDSSADGSPTVAGDLLLVPTDDGLDALGLADGRSVWAARAVGSIRGAPAAVGHEVIVSSLDGRVSRLDAGTGRVAWSKKVGSSVDTSPSVADGIAVIGTTDGWVLGVSADSGNLLWQTDTGDRTRVGTPAIDGGMVYVGTLSPGLPGNHHLIALDLVTGEIAWRVASPSDLPAYSPAIWNGTLFVDSESHMAMALDAATGAARWETPLPGVDEIVPSVVGDVVYTATDGGYVLAIDGLNGHELWRSSISGGPFGMAVTEGRVIVGTSTGTLVAIGGATQTP